MVGIDEVGRGCIAGPLLVVAARRVGQLPQGLIDSKLLSSTKREYFFAPLTRSCLFGEGWVTASEIDRHGLAKGLRLGVARALRSLQADTREQIIMDGPVNYLPKKFIRVTCLVGADATVPLVSAASIYAKVKRDRFMNALREKFPAYGFENHVGYGTPAHRNILAQHGPLKNVHRLSFRPLRALDKMAL